MHTPLCSHCFTSHALALEADRPRAVLDGEMELTDAKTLARAVWQDVAVPAYSFGVRRGAPHSSRTGLSMAGRCWRAAQESGRGAENGTKRGEADAVLHAVWTGGRCDH